MPIDWAYLNGRAATPPTFSDAQTAAAVAAANALPGKNKDPNKIPTPWPQPDKMPSIADVDFRDITVKKVPIAGLQASNKNIKRDKLLWHIQNPNQSQNPSAFTTNPIVLDSPDGRTIIDGHHRLFAMQLLGQKSASVALLPSK